MRPTRTLTARSPAIGRKSRVVNCRLASWGLLNLLLTRFYILSHTKYFVEFSKLEPLPRTIVQSVLDELGLEEKARDQLERQLRLTVITSRLLRRLDQHELVEVLLQHVQRDQANAPPRGCEFILACVARPGRAVEWLGDAESEYRRMITKLGPWPARWWYRVYVAKVVGRMLPSVVMRVLLLHKLLGLFGL